MVVTVEQAQKIRLLSDGELYRDAVDFVTQHDPSVITPAQLSGLQNAVGAGDWTEISDYITNRIKRSTLSDELHDFYQKLKKVLDELRERVEETQLVVKPKEMGRAQRRQVGAEIDRYAYLLAKEFIQHLVVECNYQRSLSNA